MTTTVTAMNVFLLMYSTSYGELYRKRGKIRWAKLSHFSRFSRAPQKFSCESLYKLRIMALLKCCNVRHRKSFPVKNYIRWNPQKFSPVNLSPVYGIYCMFPFMPISVCFITVASAIDIS